MQIRVLLIEDEDDVAGEISRLLGARCAADVVVARSRDTALELIARDEDYDLIVCDLRIPTLDGGLDVSEDHGMMVHDAARDRYPGTPSIFFSGFVNLENVGQRLATGESVDLLSTGDMWPLVDFRPKQDQPEFLERAFELATGLDEVDSLELDLPGSQSIGTYEARPLRLYTRRLGGTKIVAKRLGGLSGASVYRGEILESSDTAIGLVVAKVDIVPHIADEIDRYSRFVAPALGIGAFAPLAGQVLHGSGRFGAAFYTLAAEGHRDLFAVAVANPREASAAVRRLREALAKWGRGAEQSLESIGDLRSARISDAQLAQFSQELDRLGHREVEAVRLHMTAAVQHGDLHGHNVLVDVEGRPLIIDYGDVGPGQAVLDPVTLELSLLFHDDHPNLDGWPNVSQARQWFDLEDYVQGSPIAEVVIECREWIESAGTDLEVAAMVYAHAMRQLKYPDTDKALALAVAEAASEVVLQNSE